MELQPTHEVINVLRSVSTLHGQTQLLGILLRREGPEFQIDGHPGESLLYIKLWIPEFLFPSLITSVKFL